MKGTQVFKTDPFLPSFREWNKSEVFEKNFKVFILPKPKISVTENYPLYFKITINLGS